MTPYSGTICRLMFGTVYDYEVLGCLELVGCKAPCVSGLLAPKAETLRN